MKFEHTVELDKENFWAVIIEKYIFDPEDIECLNDSETVFESFIKL